MNIKENSKKICLVATNHREDLKRFDWVPLTSKSFADARGWLSARLGEVEYGRNFSFAVWDTERHEAQSVLLVNPPEENLSERLEKFVADALDPVLWASRNYTLQ